MSSGVQVGVPDQATLDRRLKQADKPGEHLWVVLAAWRVADPRAVRNGQGPILLDAETLVSLNGCGCFKCEEPFSNRLARRPCRGSVDGEGALK
jgi:hypothetical protein